MYYTDPKVYEFISKQTGDPIIERKTCRLSGTKFPIFQSDLKFYEKISPVFNGKKYQIPTPTLCPEERQRRRLMFRNERKLYKRTCDATGEKIVSIYAPDKSHTVYSHAMRWSDKRDALDYGFDFDFSKTFTEQFYTLVTQVPLVNLRNRESENSEYTHCCYQNKNCYMLYNTDHCEESFYSYISDELDHCMDCTFVFGAQQCYACVDSKNIYTCQYCVRCADCNYCTGCVDSTQCSYCIDCSNLDNKTYCRNNEQLTKEERMQKNVLRAHNAGKHIHRSTYFINTEKVFGNFVYNSKKSKLVFDCFDEIEKCAYASYGEKSTMTYDAYAFVETEQCYEVMSGVGLYKSQFIEWINNGPHESLYCKLCVNNCRNCFGCVGLKQKQYCIFNKQYTKEEYEKLVPQIITHMQNTGERGEFFHPSLSPFGYNETIAQDYYPLEREEALKKGYHWQDTNYDPAIPEGVETLQGDAIPNDITQVDENILKKIFICEVSGRPFRIIKQELDFYRKHHLPLPRKHPDIRHQERLEQRPGRNLYLRTCDKTGEEMVSVYPQDVPFKVYSEKVYQDEIYG